MQITTKTFIADGIHQGINIPRTERRLNQIIKNWGDTYPVDRFQTLATRDECSSYTPMNLPRWDLWFHLVFSSHPVALQQDQILDNPTPVNGVSVYVQPWFWWAIPTEWFQQFCLEFKCVTRQHAWQQIPTRPNDQLPSKTNGEKHILGKS